MPSVLFQSAIRRSALDAIRGGRGPTPSIRRINGAAAGDRQFFMAQAHRLQYFTTNQPQHLVRAGELYHAYIDQQKTGGRIADAVTALADIEPLLRQLGPNAMKAIAPVAKATRLVVIADVRRRARDDRGQRVARSRSSKKSRSGRTR